MNTTTFTVELTAEQVNTLLTAISTRKEAFLTMSKLATKQEERERYNSHISALKDVEGVLWDATH